MCAETTLDSMYLDNLDEFINDEGKIVTCKSLCLTLKVHVNVAKQMLYHYVTKKRNEDKGDDLCVTYVVSGVVAGENEQPDMQKVMLVREENLNTVKSTMKKVISVHIYSISKSQLKDLNVLYTSNIDEVKRNLMTINSYSGIECSSAKARSSADLAKLQQQNAYRDPEALPASEKKPIPEEKVPKGESKPEPKTNKNAKKPNNQIASMFARQSVKSEAQKDEKKEEKTTASKHPSAISKKSGGISAFFNKAPTSKQSQTPDSSKSSPVKTESPTTKSPRKPESDAASSPSITESIKSSFKTESQDSDSKDFHLDAKEAESSPPKKKKAKTQSKLKPKKNSQKRGKTKHSDDESPIPKRKRIMQLSDSESSSEEENEEEEESPLPDPSLIESDEEVLPSPPKQEAKELHYSQNGKVKKRKQISKTYRDEEGYLVTKKEYVYVTDSEEEMEVVKSNQENIPERKNVKSPQKVPSTKSPQKKVVKSPQSPQKKVVKSPPKKHSKDLTKTKQSSIMSFFSKK